MRKTVHKKPHANENKNAINTVQNELAKNKVKAAPSTKKTAPNIYGKDDKIKVYLRVRPLINDEKPIDYTIEGNTITIRPPKSKTTSYFCVDKSFTFRSILNESSKQKQVYDTVAEPLVKEFLNGNDVLIFCYGTTNAGKTYTVTGTEKAQGLLHRVLDYVVPILLSNDKKNPRLFVSYNEIYNERIFDLLTESDEKETLTIGYNSIGDTEIKGCSEVEVHSLEDISQILCIGEAERHRRNTEYNADSSRSHTVFRLKYTYGNKYCWLSIVDLAGSERLSVINSSMCSFREACSINKSMLVLGRCIRALKEKGTPIPYRESKLTHVFKNLFEPTQRRAYAAMVVNVSPCETLLEDTIFSLQFAAEASECSIRQLSSPDAHPCLEDEDETPPEMLYAPGSPELRARQLRVEVTREMEETLLQMKMSYEHQLSQMSELVKSQQEAHMSPQRAYSNPVNDGEVIALQETLSQLTYEYADLMSQKEDIRVESVQVEDDMKRAKECRSECEADVARLMKELDELLSQQMDTSEHCYSEKSINSEKSSDGFDVLNIPPVHVPLPIVSAK